MATTTNTSTGLSLSLSSHYDSSEEEYVTHGMQHVQSGDLFAATYELGQVIGRGSCSIVRIAKLRVTGELFACKMIQKHSVPNKQRLRDEILILMSIRHEHIISLHDICETQSQIMLVMDLAEGGEIFDRIVAKQKYAETETAVVMYSLLEALAFLHARGIIHRDLKCENILLMRGDMHIKIIDFGLAKVFDTVGEEDDDASSTATDATHSDSPRGGESVGVAANVNACASVGSDRGSVDGSGGIRRAGGSSAAAGGNATSKEGADDVKVKPRRRLRAYTSCGTDYYVAPEMLNGNGYGPSLDMWSTGVIMYILLSGFPPFANDKTPSRSRGNLNGRGAPYSSSSRANPPVDIYTKIRTGSFEFASPVWDSVSEHAKNLIRRMLTLDPDQRISAQEALSHPWMKAHGQQPVIDTGGAALDVPTSTPSPRSQALFTKFNDTRKRKLSTVSLADESD